MSRVTSWVFPEGMPSTCGSISGSFNSDACILINAVLSCQQLTEGLQTPGAKNVHFTVAIASLSLAKGHCYTLPALHMQHFSIRNMRFPWVLQHAYSFCSGAKRRSRTRRRYPVSCMHVCMYVCRYVGMHGRTQVCMYVCMSACLPACLPVCVVLCCNVLHCVVL